VTTTFWTVTYFSLFNCCHQKYVVLAGLSFMHYEKEAIAIFAVENIGGCP